MGVRPGTPKPPGSGRKRGSIDRAQRLLLSGKMAAAIWKTYRELGEGWLTQLAKDKPELFCSVFLQRLLPPALKDPSEDSPLVALNFSGDPTEAARRIAFALAKGNAELDNANDALLAERVPYVQMEREEIDPREACKVPAPDPERDAWAREAALSPEEKLNQETLDERCSRVASAATRPAWMDEPKPAGRPFVGHPRRKGDLL